MKIIKDVLDFLITDNKKKSKYLDAKKEYLKIFKKTYDERNISEKIITECLFKIEFDNAMGLSLTRFLGAMEAALIIEGDLEFGQPFEYLRIPNRIGTRVESYKEFIVRKSKEYLIKNGVL